MTEKSKDVLSAAELKSAQEWLDSWGPDGSPNWSDESGGSVPVGKVQYQKMLNTIEHWKKRAAQHGCNVEDGDHECG